jgi:hypothetical protein
METVQTEVLLTISQEEVNRTERYPNFSGRFYRPAYGVEHLGKSKPVALKKLSDKDSIILPHWPMKERGI